MTEAMPFLRNTILLSYDTRSFPGGLLIVRIFHLLTLSRRDRGCFLNLI